jgi:hypothetical protein
VAFFGCVVAEWYKINEQITSKVNSYLIVVTSWADLKIAKF